MPKGIRYRPNECDRLRLSDGLAYAIPVHRIAEQLGVPERTLRRHYSDVFRAAELNDGRPAFSPTEENRKVVLLGAGVGIPHREIARMVGCSSRTLDKYFRDELRLGATQANLKVGGTLFKAATGRPDRMPTVVAAIWWTKARMGWSEKPRQFDPVSQEGQTILSMPLVMVWRNGDIADGPLTSVDITDSGIAT